MRKWGDRYDAYRIRDIDGVHFYMAYLMPKRTEAEVYINEKIDDLLAQIQSEIPRDRERWGCSMTYWEQQVQ
jgi:hypothetical protein